MIDWIEALKTIKCDFKSEYQGGTGEYEDLNYGKQEFLWDANKSKIYKIDSLEMKKKLVNIFQLQVNHLHHLH
mgnify:CR=1 FL=1